MIQMRQDDPDAPGECREPLSQCPQSVTLLIRMYWERTLAKAEVQAGSLRSSVTQRSCGLNICVSCGRAESVWLHWYARSAEV